MHYNFCENSKVQVFLAPSGAQQMQMFVHLSVCLMKSVIELSIFIVLSQPSLRSVSGQTFSLSSDLFLSKMNKIEKNGKKYLVLFLMFLVNNLINKIMREEFSKKVRNLPKVGKHLFLFIVYEIKLSTYEKKMVGYIFLPMTYLF